MAGDQRRGSDEENLFEDLDDYFAPLDESEWPEGEEGSPPPQAPPEPGPTDGPVEDWDLEIEVPAEEELLVAGPEDAADKDVEPPAGEEPAEAEAEAEATTGDEAEEAGEAEAEEELDWDRARAEVAAAGGPEPGAEEADEIAEEADEIAVAEAEEVSAEELFEEPEPVVPEPVDSVGPGVEAPTREESPQPEAVEAAAEHFATGLRESPEEVERELLADLEAPVEETVTIESGPAPAAAPPTWQEGAEPIEEALGEAPPPPPAGGRNLFAAFASGILLAIAVIALLVIGKGAFAVFAGAVILLGQAELYAVMRTRGLQPATLLGLVCGGLMLAGAYLHGPAATLFGLALAAGLTVPWYMAAPATARRKTTVNAGVTMLGLVYVPFLASFALLLLAFPGDLGRNVFLVVLGLAVLYDVIAYAVGTLWGNRSLAPSISPNKSWEGVIGATLGILIVSLAIVPAIEPFTSSRAVGLALVLAVVAPLGDLVESAIKRDLGVKDMGTILPGHGGILDRIDAILFAAPAAYYFLQLSF
jgi:phosphatidate cytidylyltransferase